MFIFNKGGMNDMVRRRGYSRYRYSRKSRRREERAVEAITFGLIILLILIALFANLNLSGGIVSLFGGALLTGSAIYQSQRRWRVNPITWIAGIGMLFVAFLDFYQGRGSVGLLVPILIMAGVLAFSFLTGEL